MAKKNDKKKSVKKAASKPAAKAVKKAVKPVKKAAPKKIAKPAKKVAAKKPAKAPSKAAPVKAAKAPKIAAKKLAPVKPEKPMKAPKVKPEKAVKEPKIKAVEEEVVELEAAPEEEGSEEIVLTDADGRRYCRVKDCDQLASVDAYCRYHYLLFWKKIQVRKKILTEGKLERYIEELTARYPDKFLDMLRKDLRSEKEFLGAIQELEIDESAVDNEFEDEAQTYIDEVRGDVGSTGARDEEDF